MAFGESGREEGGRTQFMRQQLTVGLLQLRGETLSDAPE